jgi:hypothetical protein
VVQRALVRQPGDLAEEFEIDAAAVPVPSVLPGPGECQANIDLLVGGQSYELVVVDGVLQRSRGVEQPYLHRASCNYAVALLDHNVCVMATVHVFAHPFTDALKRRGDVEIGEVTRDNRDAFRLGSPR